MKTYAILLSMLLATLTTFAKERPNIIIILVDDMGYSDIGCMGSEIETPNLDALANEGVLFTDFYNTSRCCPSRASLLTGQYQWDAGMGHMTYTNSDAPEYQGYLNQSSVTIAEVLKNNGYRTFASGKWHVGDERQHWPDKRGFEQFYGTPVGGGIYFYPSPFYKRDVYHNGVQVHPDSTWYSTDAFTDASIDFIQQEENQNHPFFMYLPYIAPHFPLQAKKEDIAKYKGKYEVGYEAIRAERFAKQKRLGIVDSKLTISESTAHWAKVEDKKTEARKMQVYAAMIDCLDQNIGRLVSQLRKEKFYENTLIMFLSDNGGCTNNFNKTPEVEIGGANSNATYGKWYNVSNTPLRLGKTYEHEGGIKTPLIVHWPAGIKKKGLITNQPAHINDLMASCLELSSSTYPTTYHQNAITPHDGKSIIPLLRGKKQDKHRAFFWEHEGNKAVRQGQWKLVKRHKKPWELYDIIADPYELNNLITQETEKAKVLEALYVSWTQEHGVKDWPLKKKKKK